MEEKLVTILNEMAEYLSIAQMKKLQEVLLKNLSEAETPKAEMKKNCSKCSLYEICMPRLTSKKSSVSHYMQAQVTV